MQEERNEAQENMIFSGNKKDLKPGKEIAQARTHGVVTAFLDENLTMAQKTIPQSAPIPEWQQSLSNTIDRGSQRLNFVLEKLAAAGIEVVQDKNEYQWMKEQIDEINITLEMLEEKPLAIQYKEKEIGNLSTSNNDTLTRSQSLNRKSILDSSNSQEFIKNLVSLGNSKNKIDAEEFLSKLKEAFQLDKNKASTYVHNKNGNIELRLSNHCANASDSKRYDKSTSIVIKLARGKNAPKFRKSPESDLIEFAYYPENLTLESEKAIVNGLIDWVKTGEYTYTQADEVHQSTRKDFIKKHKHNQKMTYAQNEQIYGFTYDGKIYLNPEIANSEVALHEYTHLWDNYTQRTNPELWEKGKNILKDTKFWNEVKNDPNYADIADSDDLLLSEVHAQICGKMADAILTKIAERDGELIKDTVIDWDKEIGEYIVKEFGVGNFQEIVGSNIKLDSIDVVSKELVDNTNILRQFFSQPMKDFMNDVNITQNEEKSINTQGEKTMPGEKQIIAEIGFADGEIRQYEDSVPFLKDLNEATRENAYDTTFRVYADSDELKQKASDVKLDNYDPIEAAERIHNGYEWNDVDHEAVQFTQTAEGRRLLKEAENGRLTMLDARDILDAVEKNGMTLRYDPLPNSYVVDGWTAADGEKIDNYVVSMSELKHLAGIEISENSQQKENNLTENTQTQPLPEWQQRLNATISQASEMDGVKDSIKAALYDNAEAFNAVAFSREGYDRLFPDGVVQSPIEEISFADNQFDVKDQEQFMLAAYQTLSNPDLIYSETENKDNLESKNYVKTFVFGEDEKSALDIVVKTIDGQKVMISAQKRSLEDLIDRIKQPEQLVYMSQEIKQNIDRRSPEEKQRLKDVIPNLRVVPTNAAYDKERAVERARSFGGEGQRSEKRNVALETINVKEEKTMASTEKNLNLQEAVSRAKIQHDEVNVYGTPGGTVTLDFTGNPDAFQQITGTDTAPYMNNSEGKPFRAEISMRIQDDGNIHAEVILPSLINDTTKNYRLEELLKANSREFSGDLKASLEEKFREQTGITSNLFTGTEKRNVALEDEKIQKEELRATMQHTNAWPENFPSVYAHSLYYGDSVNGKEYANNVKTALLVGKAKRGDRDAAISLVSEMVNPDVIKELHAKYPDAIVCAVDGLEASGHNMIPIAYKNFLGDNGFSIDNEIIQDAKAHHTGADRLDKLLNRVRFHGEVQKEKEYILLDDHIAMGSTLRDLRDYIESNGGKVVAVTTLTAPEKDYRISVSKENLENLNKYGGAVNELLREYGITDNIKGLTDREAKEIVGVLSDRGRAGENQKGIRGSFCLHARKIQEDYLLNASRQSVKPVQKENAPQPSLAQDIIERERRKEKWRASHGKALPTDKKDLATEQKKPESKQHSPQKSSAKDYIRRVSEQFLKDIEQGSVPFMRGEEVGDDILIKVKAVRNAVTGRALTGFQQLLAQDMINKLVEKGALKRMEHELVTYEQAKECGTFIKKGSPHIMLPVYNEKTNEASLQMYYFKSGCKEPEKIDLANDKVRRENFIKRERARLADAEKKRDVPQHEKDEIYNTIANTHHAILIYMKAMHQDTTAYRNSIPAPEREALRKVEEMEKAKEEKAKEQSLQELIKESMERRHRIEDEEAKRQQENPVLFNARQSVSYEDFLGKVMAAATLSGTVVTTAATISTVSSTLVPAMRQAFDQYDHTKGFAIGENANAKCKEALREHRRNSMENQQKSVALEKALAFQTGGKIPPVQNNVEVDTYGM